MEYVCKHYRWFGDFWTFHALCVISILGKDWIDQMMKSHSRLGQINRTLYGSIYVLHIRCLFHLYPCCKSRIAFSDLLEVIANHRLIRSLVFRLSHFSHSNSLHYLAHINLPHCFLRKASYLLTNHPENSRSINCQTVRDESFISSYECTKWSESFIAADCCQKTILCIADVSIHGNHGT